MPIRFRCAYCNQLMGIGRRKAGTVVRCPSCAGEVIVPAPYGVQEPGHDQPASPGADFEAAFDLGAESNGNPLAPAPTYDHEALSVQAVAAPSAAPQDIRRQGLLLPSNMYVIAGVVAGAALLLTFLLGFLIGRWTG